MVIVEKATYENASEILDKALKTLNFNVEDGAKVLVKPNMLAAMPPQLAITTHPAIVESTVKWLKSNNADVTVGDNPGNHEKGYGDRASRVTKIADASQGCYRNLALEPETIKLSSEKTDYAVISKSFLKSDMYITLPKFKTHQLTTMTGAIKNSFGMLIGAEKTRMHSLCNSRESFSRLIVDIFSIRPPDLVIVDAILGMEGTGPGRTGTPREIGLLIIGKNAVEVDSVIAAHMGLFPNQVDFIKIAGERGLGENDLRKIHIVNCEGNDSLINPLTDFMLPKVAIGKVGTFLGPLLHIRTPMPKVDTDKCNACGDCYKSCPADAIEIGDTAIIDDEKCLECFCCQELCPSAAISTHRPLFKVRKKKYVEQ